MKMRNYHKENFYVEPRYDRNRHSMVWEIWRYDANAKARYRAALWPFGDYLIFHSYIQAVKFLKENSDELV